MKVALMYESRTGNTELIANAIKEELGDDVIYYGEPRIDVEADLYVIGSCTDKGLALPTISNLVMSLKDTKIAYFCTAGFGQNKDYASKLVGRIEEIADPSSDLVGSFCCQGKMPLRSKEKQLKRLEENPDDAFAKIALANFEAALTHPDKKDLDDAKAWIRSVVDKCKNKK